jgi:acyl-CoA dehydrogenase
MKTSELPFFEDRHRELAAGVARLCADRLGPLSLGELEDADSAAVEYIALLGQEGLFDPAMGRALEGEAPRPDLRSLLLIREQLASTTGLADAAFGAQVEALFPIALTGDEDQRAIHLPGIAAGQTIVGLALLDGTLGPAEVVKIGEDYVLSGSKALVPLAPVADRFVVLAGHADTGGKRKSLFVVEASACECTRDETSSSIPLGQLRFDQVELDEEARLGGEGMGLVVAQAAMDMFRLPMSAACVGLGWQAINKGVKEILRRDPSGQRSLDAQGHQWALAEIVGQLEGARAMIAEAAWRRDASNAREVLLTAAARQMAQSAGEQACLLVAELLGTRPRSSEIPWERLLNEVRALRLEWEFLDNPRTSVAQALISQHEKAS